MDLPLSQIKPMHLLHQSQQKKEKKEEDPSIQSTLKTLNLKPHLEGGYYTKTDRNPLRMANPFNTPNSIPQAEDDSTRSASTAMYYYLTPSAPLGVFHRNRARTVHTWHRGRGRYVIIHADEGGENTEGGRAKTRVESFVVGPDVARGERMQWVIDGDKYKASYLLPDSPGHDASEDGTNSRSEGLLITEVGPRVSLKSVYIG